MTAFFADHAVATGALSAKQIKARDIISPLSTTLENEAIATVENEATQTDWMGDLGGGLGVDQAACRGRGSAAAGRAAVGDRSVDG
jgi:hypothetical protein